MSIRVDNFRGRVSWDMTPQAARILADDLRSTRPEDAQELDEAADKLEQNWRNARG